MAPVSRLKGIWTDRLSSSSLRPPESLPCGAPGQGRTLGKMDLACPGEVLRPLESHLALSWLQLGYFLLQLEFCVFNPWSDSHSFCDWSSGLLGTQVSV